MSDGLSPEGVIEVFQTQLDRDWAIFRTIEGNDTARGMSYEEGLYEVLSQYFEGIYALETNCSVMDDDLDCIEAFDPHSKNEVDVVALFKQAVPRVILRRRKVTWIPLSAVAFLCEVKSKVDSGRLEADLLKLEILRSIEGDPKERFKNQVRGNFVVDRQIHCLVYDQAEIANDTMTELLNECAGAWDMVLIVKSNTLIVNGTLPYSFILRNHASSNRLDEIAGDEEGGGVTRVMKIPPSGILSVDNGFAWFMILLGWSVPYPFIVQTTTLFENIAKSLGTGAQHGARTEVVGSEGLLEDPSSIWPEGGKPSSEKE